MQHALSNYACHVLQRRIRITYQAQRILGLIVENPYSEIHGIHGRIWRRHVLFLDQKDDPMLLTIADLKKYLETLEDGIPVFALLDGGYIKLPNLNEPSNKELP